MPSAQSEGCRFCGTCFPGFGETREAAEADATAIMMNHQLSCSSNPANQE